MGGGVDKWCFYDYIKTRVILIIKKNKYSLCFIIMAKYGNPAVTM